MTNVSDITEHMTLNRRDCLRCGTLLARKSREVLKDWRVRKYCDQSCRARHARNQDPSTRFQKYLNTAPGQGPRGECHEWAGHLSDKGYGRLRVGAKMWIATRLAWVLEHGSIPDDMFVCHECDNPACARIEHLFLGTRQQNMDDMVRKGRGSAPRGTAHYNQRLTEEQMAAIMQDTRTGAVIAADFGLTKGYVNQLKARKGVLRDRRVSPKPMVQGDL